MAAASAGPRGYDFDGGHASITATSPAPGYGHSSAASAAGRLYPGDDERRLMQTVKEQEEQFDRLTRELEAERQSVVHQLEKFRLVNSATTSASSLTSGTDVPFRPCAMDHSQRGDSSAYPISSSDRLNRDLATARRSSVDFLQPPAQPLPRDGDSANDFARGRYCGGAADDGSRHWKASQTSLSRQQRPEGQQPPTSGRATGDWGASAEPAAESYNSDFFIASREASLPYGYDDVAETSEQPSAAFPAGRGSNGNLSANGPGTRQVPNAMDSPYGGIEMDVGAGNQDYANMRVGRDFDHEVGFANVHPGGVNGFLPDHSWTSPYDGPALDDVGPRWSDLHDHTLSDQWEHASNNESARGNPSFVLDNQAASDRPTDAKFLHGQSYQSDGLRYRSENSSAQPQWPMSIFDDQNPDGVGGARPQEEPWSSQSRATPSGGWQPWMQVQHSSQQHLDYPDSPQLYPEEARQNYQDRPPSVAGSHRAGLPSLAGSHRSGPASVAGSDVLGRSGYDGPAAGLQQQQQRQQPRDNVDRQQPPRSFFGSRQSLLSQAHDRRGQLASSPELSDIIEFLEHPSNTVKANAAAYLQHVCFRNNNVKAKMRVLGAVPALVKLLESQAPEMQRHACGGLLNLSHGPANVDGKKEILRCNGLEKLCRLLRTSQDNDVSELVTGILWNISSSKDLKRAIIDSSLTILVNEVIIPHSGYQLQDSSTDRLTGAAVYWPAVFRNASGVLRNISSDGYYARKRLREFPGLVQSLIHLVKAAIGKNDIDNKSVENSVCVLRNLSYRLMEVDYPDHYDDDNPSHPRRQSEPSVADIFPGCFATSGRKAASNIQKISYQSRTTAGAGRGELLWQPEMMNIYLPLLADCSNPDTLEAAAGAVQNLAACEWQPSADLREKVRKEKGLPVIVELLGLDADNVVCAAAIALRNLALDQRNKELIGKYAIQQLISRLPQSSGSEPQFRISETTMRAIMATLHEVIQDTVDYAGSLASDGDGIAQLMAMARSRSCYEGKTLRCVHQLLTTLWGFTLLHALYKSRGWREADFISKTMHPRSSAASPMQASPAGTLTRAHHHASASTVNEPAVAAAAGDSSASSWQSPYAAAGGTLRQLSDRRASLARTNHGFNDNDEDNSDDARAPQDYHLRTQSDSSKLPNGDTVGMLYGAKAYDASPASNSMSNDYVTYPAYQGASGPVVHGSQHLFSPGPDLDTTAASAQASPGTGAAFSEARAHRALTTMASENEPLYARLARRGEVELLQQQQLLLLQQSGLLSPLASDTGGEQLQLHDYGIQQQQQPAAFGPDEALDEGFIGDFSRGSLVQLQGAIDGEAMHHPGYYDGNSGAAIDSWV